MKSNTRLLRRPLGRQRLLTPCVPSTPADTQLWKQRHILHWPCCRSVCATAGVTLQPHPHMNTEKRSDTRFIFKLKKKNNTLQLKQQAWSHFSKSYVKLCGQHLGRELKNLHLNLKQLFSRPRSSAVMPIVTTQEDKQLILCNLLKSEKFEAKVKANQMPREVTLQCINMNKYCMAKRCLLFFKNHRIL